MQQNKCLYYNNSRKHQLQSSHSMWICAYVCINDMVILSSQAQHHILITPAKAQHMCYEVYACFKIVLFKMKQVDAFTYS